MYEWDPLLPSLDGWWFKSVINASRERWWLSFKERSVSSLCSLPSNVVMERQQKEKARDEREKVLKRRNRGIVSSINSALSWENEFPGVSKGYCGSTFPQNIWENCLQHLCMYICTKHVCVCVHISGSPCFIYTCVMEIVECSNGRLCNPVLSLSLSLTPLPPSLSLSCTI